MTNFTYRILGYNHDFGVVRIESEGTAPRDVVIFASQSIQGQLRLNSDEVIFVSKTGETVRLNLAIGEITQRAKPFRHCGYHCKLFLSKNARHLICVSNYSISTVDLETLTLIQTFDAVLKDESGVLRLKDYEDIKAPFEQKASEGHQRRLASQKENPKGPWFVSEWSWASKLRSWPINVGDAFRPEFQARAAALRDDGTIVAPFTKRDLRKSASSDLTKGFGVVRMDLTAETITFEELGGFTSNIQNHIVSLTFSDGGKALLLDRHNILRRDGSVAKPKRMFGFARNKNKCEFEHLLEIWRIEDTTVFDRYVSVGQTPAILTPEKPSEDRKRSYPNLYKNDVIAFEIDTCRLNAAELQYETLFKTLTWSTDKFKSDFQAQLTRRKTKIDDKLARQLERNQGLHFGVKPFLVERFLNMALKTDPHFLQNWQKKPLNAVQADTLDQIYTVLNRFTQNPLAIEWRNMESDLHILEKPGRLRRVRSGETQSDLYNIAGLTEGIKDPMQVKFSRQNDASLHIVSTHNHGRVKDGLLIDLPIKTHPIEKQDVVPTRRIYDAESYKAEHDIAEKLSRKRRRGYVTTRSKSAKNLSEGLEKLTKEYARYHDEIVLSARWDAGLFHKKSLILEKEIARLIVQEKDQSAIPVLTNFVQTIMQVSAKEIWPIPAYPRDLTEGHIHWGVWHNDDGTQVGMPSVNALIALSDKVPDLALTFYRYRDFEHDGYTDQDGLLTDVLPHISLETPGVLKLLAITSFQFLATGRVENKLFAQHGMDRVAEALENETLSPKLAAQIFVEEVKGLQGELSWGENLGPHGLVAQAVYGLDKSHAGKMAFGKAMLDLYPEAHAYLAKGMAS